MSYKKTIFTGTLILTLSGFLSRILGFYNRIFLSNLIGARELGIYQLIFPVYMLCFTLVCHGFETGISNLTSRFYAVGEKANIHRLIRLTAAMAFFLALLLMTILYEGAGYLSGHLLHETSAAPALRIAALSLPFVAVKSCLHGYYIGLNRSAVPAASQLIEQCARVGSIYLLSVSVYLFTADARIAAWGMVIGEAASTVYTILAYLYTNRAAGRKHFTDVRFPAGQKRPVSTGQKSMPFSHMVREFFSFSVPLTSTADHQPLFPDHHQQSGKYADSLYAGILSGEPDPRAGMLRHPHRHGAALFIFSGHHHQFPVRHAAARNLLFL